MVMPQAASASTAADISSIRLIVFIQLLFKMFVMLRDIFHTEADTPHSTASAGNLFRLSPPPLRHPRWQTAASEVRHAAHRHALFSSFHLSDIAAASDRMTTTQEIHSMNRRRISAVTRSPLFDPCGKMAKAGLLTRPRTAPSRLSGQWHIVVRHRGLTAAGLSQIRTAFPFDPTDTASAHGTFALQK